MSYPKVDFLYLDEPSMLKAGVCDMPACMDVVEECYHLLGQGDYVMGGKIMTRTVLRSCSPKHPRSPICRLRVLTAASWRW